MTLDLAEQKIIDAFRRNDWSSPAPVDAAIEATLAYRRELCQEEQRLFDAEVERGRHPSMVIETLEAISGRDARPLRKRRPLPEPITTA